MMEKSEIQEARLDALFKKVSTLIEQSRHLVYATVNVAEVKTRYEVGRYIFEDEQQGERAKYGQQILKNLSALLMERYGGDWTYDTLKRCRYFYKAYENVSIGATSLPQSKQKGEVFGNKEVANWSNGVATIRLPRFTLSWSHYLVCYNRLLRCYVLIDLKTAKLTHQDLGQMQMYVNYYDRYVKLPDENPTIGILLCEEKNDALVELTLPEDAHIYASQYSLYLPDKALLQSKLKEWIDEFNENNPND